MEKSAVTEYFLNYFWEYGINKVQISEKTGIAIEKFSENYRQPLTAEEFLKLCVVLGIEPEEVREYVKQHPTA